MSNNISQINYSTETTTTTTLIIIIIIIIIIIMMMLFSDALNASLDYLHH